MGLRQVNRPGVEEVNHAVVRGLHPEFGVRAAGLRLDHQDDPRQAFSKLHVAQKSPLQGLSSCQRHARVCSFPDRWNKAKHAGLAPKWLRSYDLPSLSYWTEIGAPTSTIDVTERLDMISLLSALCISLGSLAKRCDLVPVVPGGAVVRCVGLNFA